MVAALSGADHCQPMVSWDHRAPPTPRKTAAQQVSEARLARTRAWAPGAHPHSPASTSRATIAPRITSAVRAPDRGRSLMSEIRSSVNSSP